VVGDKPEGRRSAVTRKAYVFFVVMTAAAILCPAVASAGTQCQSAPVTGLGPGTDDAAIAEWSAQAKQTYGAEWSNFNLAKNPKYSDQNLGLAVMHIVTAYPCRTIAVVPIAKPNLTLQRH
jgi:hypothetical protein